MLVLGNLTQVAGHQEEEERSQMVGWDPKTEVGTPPSAEIESKKVSFWTWFVGDRTKSQVLRVKEDEEYFRHEETILFKPVLKIA